MRLQKGRWYAVQRYQTISGDTTIGQYQGMRGEVAVIWGIDGGSIMFRSMQSVKTDMILTEVPDPRYIIKVAKWTGRNLLGLDYVN